MYFVFTIDYLQLFEFEIKAEIQQFNFLMSLFLLVLLSLRDNFKQAALSERKPIKAESVHLFTCLLIRLSRLGRFSPTATCCAPFLIQETKIAASYLFLYPCISFKPLIRFTGHC